MSALTDKIANQCCGVLLGAEVKAQLIAEIATLETNYDLAQAELVEAALNLAEVEKQGLARLKQVFLSMYKGKRPEKAWQSLVVELSL